MDRERMKELAQAQKLERIAQTRLEHGESTADLLINERAYKLVANYRDAYQDDLMAERFSTFLEKYDYLVGDIAADQLRIHGFYKDGTPGVSRMDQISALQDYIYEFMNFGAPYFVLENLEPHMVEDDEPEVSRPRRRRNHHSNKNNAYIDEKKSSVKKNPVKKATHQLSSKGPRQVTTKGNNRKRRFEIHERSTEGE
ncbi:YutD family protein [Weissella koreensis]|uniref:YutD family protein n=1 Tax=Weissella koreensis TaxID=165096 RepID=UPI0022BA1BFB|nr:YutD family protein [Weissella koreensis]MCZ9311524.1 YutD family protein [Weissella koreensis]